MTKGGQNAENLMTSYYVNDPQNHLRYHVTAIIAPRTISKYVKSNFMKLIKVKCQPEFNMFKPWRHLPNVTDCKCNTIRIFQILQEIEQPLTTLFS